jgi:hypothetical protein
MKLLTSSANVTVLPDNAAKQCAIPASDPVLRDPAAQLDFVPAFA